MELSSIRKGFAPNEKFFKAGDYQKKLLEETLIYCQENKANVYFVVLPAYNSNLTRTGAVFLNHMKTEIEKYDAKILYLANDTAFHSKKLFTDRFHTSIEGANLLTKRLAEKYTNGLFFVGAH